MYKAFCKYLYNSIVFIFLIFIFQNSLFSQVIPGMNRSRYIIPIQMTRQPLVLDGLLNDPAWQSARRVDHFHRVLPMDTGYAKAQTEVMLSHDEKYLYLAVICHDTLPGKRPVESLRRDFSFPKNDNFIVFMDTYNDQTNGFAFGISAAGVQWEGIQANGGFVNLEWDCKWKSAVKSYPDRWVAEFAIPFRSIRYKVGVKEWGINFSRLDLKTAEKSSWAPVPRQFQTANLAFTGTLLWDMPPPDLGLRYSLIPSVIVRYSHDVQEGGSGNYDFGGGLDAKITPSTSMNLDITIHPDYSQVEVDRQVINLDRYELFFPEKRKFFQENSDLFASIGKERLRPFFSRRIGLATPVWAGARLSGQIGKNWRTGIMDMQTGSKDTVPAANFAVAVFQRKVFRRSNISFFMVNKQTTGPSSTEDPFSLRYNRVAGIEYNLASSDSRWTGKFFYHQAFSAGIHHQAFSLAEKLMYDNGKVQATMEHAWVGRNFIAETGYVPRTGFQELTPGIQYKFYPSSSHLANHGPFLKSDMYFSTDFHINDSRTAVGYGLEWLNRSKFKFDLSDNYILLLEDYDPTHTGGVALSSGSDYHWQEAGFSYISDVRRLFNFTLTMIAGGYYNGHRTGFASQFSYRIQPFANLTMDLAFNRIALPAPYSSANLILVGPKLDLTFTDKLFLSTFVQYNNQIDNINVNVRFQWRYAPVSDLYIVYTDNSYPDGFMPKNRALVLKLSYWFH